jgi:hypothetical protein
MDKQKLLIELELMLKGHDWYYSSTEDMRWWEQGVKQKIEIDKVVAQLGKEGQDLYDKYNPFKKTIS